MIVPAVIGLAVVEIAWALLLAAPDVKARLFASGVEVRTSTPEEFDAYTRAEMQRWSKVVRQSRASVD